MENNKWSEQQGKESKSSQYSNPQPPIHNPIHNPVHHPKAFFNTYSVAHKDSLHNQLKNFLYYPPIVEGGVLITSPHYCIYYDDYAAFSNQSLSLQTLFVSARAFVGQPLEFFSKTAQRWLPCALVVFVGWSWDCCGLRLVGISLDFMPGFSSGHGCYLLLLPKRDHAGFAYCCFVLLRDMGNDGDIWGQHFQYMPSWNVMLEYTQC